jgi:hypothetical protein
MAAGLGGFQLFKMFKYIEEHSYDQNVREYPFFFIGIKVMLVSGVLVIIGLFIPLFLKFGLAIFLAGIVVCLFMGSLGNLDGNIKLKKRKK